MICANCCATASINLPICEFCEGKRKPPVSLFYKAVAGYLNNHFTLQQKLFLQKEYEEQSRNPSTALVLAFVLGGAGAHRFYLRQWRWGIAYLAFAWTFIPLTVALIECFVIKERTERYDARLIHTIVEKAAVMFSEQPSQRRQQHRQANAVCRR